MTARNCLNLLISSLVLISYAEARRTDLIQSLIVDESTLIVKANDEFTRRFLNEDFTAKYDSDIDLNRMEYSIQTIPFLLNVITIIWISGKDYYIDEMDIDLYDSLLRIKKVFQRMYPKTSWEGNLVPRKLVDNKHLSGEIDPEKKALLFSGGLDSLSTAIEHKRNTLLLITARGQWDVPLDNANLWSKRKRSFQQYALDHDHENAFVRSNFSQFLNWDVLDELSPEIISWRIDGNEGIGMFGLAAPIMYSKGYPTLLMSATYHWAYPYPSAANPLIDDNLNFAGIFNGRHAQFDKTRTDKLLSIIDKVTDGSIEIPRMKVCDGRNANNCLDDDCQKCIPTSFTLLALGQDPRSYGFDFTDDQIIEATQKFLKQKQYYWVLWELQYLQEYLKKQDNDNEDIEWFLDLDLTDRVDTEYIKTKKKLNWQKFEDIAPKGLVPDTPLRELT